MQLVIILGPSGSVWSIPIGSRGGLCWVIFRLGNFWINCTSFFFSKSDASASLSTCSCCKITLVLTSNFFCSNMVACSVTLVAYITTFPVVFLGPQLPHKSIPLLQMLAWEVPESNQISNNASLPL
eukprot:TRINITY_DN32449_c0_g1_i1.p1 TRINITY_DN32449_c0_g1~~TRINITY_DN32449_c0_g1_i1.p1  ORF type:complete len:126 (-),score=16.10 TRINITY_DN32449_c0_g1_i1:29-406(-)